MYNIFAMLLISEMLGFIAFITVPIICDILTVLFFEYNTNEIKNDIDLKELTLLDEISKVKIKTKIQVLIGSIILILFNIF